MLISFCFSSSEGDVPVDNATLDRPFILEPFRDHPFMTLRDYFLSIQNFILRESGLSLISLLRRLWDREVELGDIDNIIVRYEKYGTLYQIASVTISSRGKSVKLAVSTALSVQAKATLDREFDLLHQLNGITGLPYLPQVYWKQRMTVQKEEGTETPLMSLSQWFEGYHEWHFSRDDEGREGIIIWDMGGGYRFASEHEAYEIIRQASKILCLYYDMETCRRISPWHHGAGDFVVKTGDGTVDVKLVTARGYEPIVLSNEKTDPSRALMLFLLETTVKMRLDKYEGMGYSIWAASSLLGAVMDGFFQALRMKEHGADNKAIKVDEFVSFFKCVSADEIQKLLLTHVNEYRLHDSSDYAIFSVHLDDHAREVYRTIQGQTNRSTG
jgi:hypothetical protein